MFQYFRNRREIKNGRMYRDGYQWAAGELLSGSPISFIEDLIYGHGAYDADAESHFDKGAKTAIIDWERKFPNSSVSD